MKANVGGAVPNEKRILGYTEDGTPVDLPDEGLMDKIKSNIPFNHIKPADLEKPINELGETPLSRMAVRAVTPPST